MPCSLCHCQPISERIIYIAGLHYLATARPSPLRYVSITSAGLMDPTSIDYAPAIKIDYNTHTLEYLQVMHCASSGIEIMHNDVYANARIAHSKIAYNQGNGVSTRGPFFTVEFTDVHDNLHNGIEYNPHYTTFEAYLLRQGINDPLVINDALESTGYKIPDEVKYRNMCHLLSYIITDCLLIRNCMRP